ncbi:MAG TPA: hypothetical protein VLS94_09615, partial [Fusibacter sp.]|nr:hypothetical protein [Fusibacter sp.]
MIDIKCIKNKLNPLNAVVAGIIMLFICIRIFSNNQENAFIIETMNPAETSEINETQLSTSSQTQTSEQTSDQPSDDQPNVTTEPLAYSAEMGKTFNLDAFNQLSKE